MCGYIIYHLKYIDIFYLIIILNSKICQLTHDMTADLLCIPNSQPQSKEHYWIPLAPSVCICLVWEVFCLKNLNPKVQDIYRQTESLVGTEWLSFLIIGKQWEHNVWKNLTSVSYCTRGQNNLFIWAITTDMHFFVTQAKHFWCLERTKNPNRNSLAKSDLIMMCCTSEQVLRAN